MKKITIADLYVDKKYYGEAVTVTGFIDKFRKKDENMGLIISNNEKSLNVMIPLEFINGNSFSETRPHAADGIQYAVYRCGRHARLRCHRLDAGAFVESCGDVGRQPRCTLMILWQKRILFKEPFAARTGVTPFPEHYRTVLHLERKVFYCLHPVIMDPSRCPAASRTNLRFRLCFDEKLHVNVTSQSFFQNNIFQSEDFCDKMILHFFVPPGVVGGPLALGGLFLL